jgi:NTE family protein
MRNYLYILLGFLFFFSPLNAQKVGLVLSGGGARGIAHIGVIQALEDNNIPIDYITGTSIGAVVGALYSMGYSPKEMLEIFKSEEFAYWQAGKVQENYVYSFREKDPTPDIFTLRFNIQDSLVITSRYLPISFIDPVQMNLVFLSLFSQATAACNDDFDKLFVPFRCVASDVYKKEAVVFRSGDLGDAVRASMSIPFVFKPIMIDDRLLFDGGIYDNFPVGVLQKDFTPNYIIGSTVSTNPTKPNDSNIPLQIENMIIQHTDYSIKEEDGMLIDFTFDNNTGLLDFNKADELYQIGYNQALKRIPELKAKIKREQDNYELQVRRETFKKKLPELRFKKIKITGVNYPQKRYILNALQAKGESIDLEQFKDGYFKLLADKKISEIIPHAVYDEEDQCFDLLLDVKFEDEILFSIGGNVSSSVSSQAYFDLDYQTLSSYGLNFDLSAQFGKVYNALRLVSQIDIPSSELPFYLKLTGNIHTFDYYQGNEPFYENNLTTSISQKENYLKLNLGLPFMLRSKIEVGGGYGLLKDFYYQPNISNLNNTSDENSYVLSNLFLQLISNTLNDKQYPNEGMLLKIMGEAVSGQEVYTSSTDIEDNGYKKNLSWIQVNANIEKYYKLNNYYTLGLYGNAVFSSRGLANNYTATVLEAPRFCPTTHSLIVFNEAFCANQYLAGGIKPIYNINGNLSLESEFYAFVPVYPIKSDENNKAYYGKSFSEVNGLGQLSLIYRFPFASISIFGNYYTAPQHNWNFGFNIGYLIFNDRLLY